MGLFVYTQKGSIISTVDLPTTEIIEPIYTLRKSKSVVVDLILQSALISPTLNSSFTVQAI
ncbi:hypothetical protein ODU06_06580, partial [Streptococcus suis]